MSAPIIVPSQVPEPVAKPIPCDFGTHLQTMASAFSLAPVDVALATAAMLGGLAGPLAGMKDAYERRIAPGINLLRLPGASARVRALQDLLIHPVRTAQRSLRQHAGRMMRSVVDAHAFGLCGAFEKVKDQQMMRPEVWNSHKERVQHALDTVANGFQIPQVNEDPVPTGPVLPSLSMGVRPGPRPSAEAYRHPSVILENMDLGDITGALSEVLDREALWLDVHGTNLQHSLSHAKRSKADMDHLTRLMEGCDMSFPRAHREQGYGTLQHAQIHLLSAVSPDQVMSLLASPDQPGRCLLHHCLLWAPEECKGQKQEAAQRGETWLAYHDVVNGILQARAGGRGPVVEMHKSWTAEFARQQDGFMNFLSSAPARLADLVSQFHDLPARLLWAFMLLEQPEERPWCLEAAFHAAHVLVERHFKRLVEFEKLAQEHEARRIADAIAHLLEEKGPSKFRTIARCANKQTRAELMPAIDLLKREGRLALNASGLYQNVKPQNAFQSSEAISSSFTTCSAN